MSGGLSGAIRLRQGGVRGSGRCLSQLIASAGTLMNARFFGILWVLPPIWRSIGQKPGFGVIFDAILSN